MIGCLNFLQDICKSDYYDFNQEILNVENTNQINEAFQLRFNIRGGNKKIGTLKKV